MMERAIDSGFNVLVLPGFAQAGAIAELQHEYPEVCFVGNDLSAEDLGEGGAGPNVCCAVYREEYSGFMAGYAAVRLGYTHLGFLGGMAVPGVVRYGYGFLQGADAAAAETGAEVTVEYVYGNQFYGDADITAAMDTWYQNLGVECVFACGGGIYTSVAEAAARVPGAKIIGVDVDQAPIIDGAYGEGLTLTSAMKGLHAAVKTTLGDILAGDFARHSGKTEALGLVSEIPEENYVQLAPSTQWGEGFTREDYAELVGRLARGELPVSGSTEAPPATGITVHFQGSIK